MTVARLPPGVGSESAREGRGDCSGEGAAGVATGTGVVGGSGVVGVGSVMQ